MKRIELFVAVCCLFIAQPLFAQPSAVKNVQKSVFTLKTYSKDGALLETSCGLFAGQPGEAVSHYKPFVGAYSAEVVDASGKTFAVKRIIGANESHNLIHFTVDGKTTPVKSIADEAPVQGAKLYCVGTKQSGMINEGAVKAVEPFLDKYTYYTIKLVGQDGLASCPFVTEQGQVIGLLEISNTTSDAFSSDLRYALTLKISGITASDMALQKVHIPLQLPEAQSDAQVAMVMLQGDSVKYVNAARDYMQMFPNLSDGYAAVAQIESRQKNYEQAESVMLQAIKNADDKDAAHYEYSKLMLNNVLNLGEEHYAEWSLEKAMEEAQAANALKQSVVYDQLEAQIVFAQGNYQDAYERFMSIAKTEVRPSEYYYQAARCKQMLQASNEEVVALLDSAINNIDSLNIVSAAPYFWMRGTYYDVMGKYRDAVLDYSRYQVFMNNRVNDVFFYTRFNAEVNGRLYQQALLDIANCIYFNPQEPLYPAEKAQLEIKVGMFDEAIASANYCIKIAPENYAGYTLLGLAQAKKEMKAEALQNLLKAKELGDPQADTLIEKFKLR